MDEIRFRKQQSNNQWRFRCEAQALNEVSNLVEEIIVKATLYFTSSFVKKEEERNLRFTPKDKLYIHFKCLNDNCTGDGFDLTSEAMRLIYSKDDKIWGTAKCSGQLDSNHMNDRTYSCDSKIEYEISIIRKND